VCYTVVKEKEQTRTTENTTQKERRKTMNFRTYPPSTGPLFETVPLGAVFKWWD
jgi:hypothetical protein